MKELPLNLEKGDIVDIDGVEHVFDRIDPDGRITFTSLRQRVEYRVPDADGEFEKPVGDDIAALMIAGKFILRARDLEEGPRQAARKREVDAKTAREEDPTSTFRTVFSRAFDKNPCSRSDRALQELNQTLLDDPKIAAMPGARLYVGSTLREWVNTRGHPGDRRARDGVSMAGRSGRLLRVNHPKEIIEHWVANATGRKSTSSPTAKAPALKAWQDYKGEINRINAGRPTGRDGPAYPQPAEPYKAVSYTTFWRVCRDLQSSATLEAKHGKQAVYQRYGGGGLSERPTRMGALCGMDETPVPGIFLIDEERSIPLGQPTFTVLMEYLTKGIWGWDLSWESASSATGLRTYAHANTPKAIPADIDALHPELKWMAGKPAAILVDNLTGYHARHFEDSLLDAGTDVHFAGSNMPRDKSEEERMIGTILDLAFKDLPAASYDIPRAREFGFDPDTMIMVTLRKAQTLLTRAICVHNLSPHDGADGRSPALSFKQNAAKHGITVIEDMDEFHRAIGMVEYKVKLKSSGVVIQGLRYSDAKITRVLIDDLVSLQAPSKSRTKAISLLVKVKYSPDDMASVHVWNERTKRYVTLPCTRPGYATGMPLWAHKRVVEIARRDMLDYAGEDELTEGDRLIEIRKTLFEEIRNINPEAAERDSRALAKLKDNPLFQRVMGEIIEVVDEDLTKLVHPVGAGPDHTIADELASGHRQDGTIPTPRPRPRPTPTADSRAAGRPGRDRAGRGGARNAGSPKRSETSDKPAGGSPATTAKASGNPPAAKSNLKWGTNYD